jgi:hypothetical protein
VIAYLSKGGSSMDELFSFLLTESSTENGLLILLPDAKARIFPGLESSEYAVTFGDSHGLVNP